MRRFYKDAAHQQTPDGFEVRLDGKPIRTPGKALLSLPSAALAAAIAEEWREQGDSLSPATLPLTRLAGTAIDLIAPRREAAIGDIAKYAGTDLVCYRAEHPPELAARQHRAWQPLIDWASTRYDAPLKLAFGVVPVAQSPATLLAFRAAIAAMDSMRLAGLGLATEAAGSIVVALALLEGRIPPEEAFACAELEQSFEIERWGEDHEQTIRRAGVREDLTLAARFAALMKG